jgi:uncharacterized protein (TIGR02118 family)
MFKVSVLYPAVADDQFDMDYYLNTHTGLVKSLLEPEGLIKADIEEGVAGNAPGTPPDYKVICGLFFPSIELLQTALEKHGMELMMDIPNFTGVVPTLQISKVL